jgi:hypothetical protein
MCLERDFVLMGTHQVAMAAKWFELSCGTNK